MNWVTALLGEAPQKSKVREGLCFRVSTLFDGVGSCRHSAELHWFWRCRVGTGQVAGLACPIVKNAAVLQVEGETNKIKGWFIFKNNVSAVESAVQEQFDSWQLFEPTFRNPQSIVDLTQAEQIVAHAGACDANSATPNFFVRRNDHAAQCR